ncbi:hypothetical protein GCK72_000900 [Caenorhabditis remanei]|uniref:Uncharacterized protein n=1 Tax=Caenorhabditis remanei TaxID=31234 RepID=A0A6A5HRX1_CAERE|nr:hypothetical protein GCK72_000900 [Caenorhabditis remanei]KAF1769087.1 hypothetical protein GCK72_000900 [Caenorhabditis remanei]
MDSDEVRKRKEYAERKVKERHAALRKEAGERRKQTLEHRERVQSVLKREQVLLQKRMQQLNEDEERKKATLAKQHEATSRTAAINKSSPKSFAFGSSTPRTLAYLDNLPKSEQQYDKKLRPLEDSSQLTSPTSTSSSTKFGRTTASRPPPAAHRPAPAMSSMTSSMYVTSSAPPTRHAKTSIKSSITTTSTTKKAPVASMMTQSVYTPSSRPATTSRLSMGAAKPNRGATPTSARTNHPISSTPNRRSMDTRKPPMPRKSILERKQEAKKEVTPVSDAPVVEVEEESQVETVVVATETSPLVEETTEQETEVLRPETPEVVAQEVPQPEEKPVEVVTEEPKEVEEVHVAPEQTQQDVEETPRADSPAPVAESTVDKVEEEAEKPVEKPEDVIILPSETVEHESVNEVHEEKPTEIVESVHQEEEEEEHHEEEHHETSGNTSLADELISIGIDQNMSQDEIMPSKPEVVELEYPLIEEKKVPVAAVNDLVDVFGNDFINQNQPQRMVEFDEDTDSGKASPTSSETSSTTDEVTPRSVIEEVKVLAPRVLPIVRSAEDMARKEKEAREAEERKNRLAAILAKSRGMASPMTNTLPPTAADIKDSSPVTTSPPSPPRSPQMVAEQPTSSAANASTEESADKATNESGRANDVLARVAAMTNSSTLQKILQRKQGSNPSLQTSESTGGEIY